MKESQLWLIVAQFLASGFTSVEKGKVCHGICRALYMVRAAGCMDYAMKEQMHQRMNLTFPFSDHGDLSGYFWLEGQLAPRLNACGLLSALAEEEGK